MTADRQTILLVHGFPLDGRMWEHQRDALGSTFQVLAPDLDGHGVAPVGAPSHRIDDMAAALVQRLDAADVGAVHLAGFSMGGYVALALLRLFPDRVLSLALVDSRAAADSDAGRAGRDTLAAAIRAGGATAAADAMMPKMFTDAAPGDLRDRTRGWMLEQPVETLVADLAAMRDRPDSTALLGGIGVPVLVLAGEEDPIIPVAEAEQVAAAVPDGRLVVVRGASHLAPLEQPEQVNAALLDFFGKAA